MLSLDEEKSLLLSAKDRYDILNFAAQAADENGFVNSFVFGRAIWCYALILLTEDEDKKNEIRSKVAADLIAAWDSFVEEDIFSDLLKKDGVQKAFDVLAQESEIWIDEYTRYATSARGIVSLVENFTNAAVNNAASALENTANATGVSEVLDIADKWGMNRQVAVIKKPKAELPEEEGTLF